MAGIAGCLKEGQHELVAGMLERISHRGNFGKTIIEHDGATIGVVWSEHEEKAQQVNLRNGIFKDGPGFGQLLEVKKIKDSWQICRDELGVVPLFFTNTNNGIFSFASEIKALTGISRSIVEMPAGHIVTRLQRKKYFSLELQAQLPEDPEAIAGKLLNLLTVSVTRRITADTMGSWLSGGLDSSTIAALARPWVNKLHTFAGGIGNAPDLEFAREVSKFIGSEHHEVIVNLKEILQILPSVIYHLESFDALLIRSSIINYLVARHASDYVGEVFSGEGGDELFAGYQYLKSLKKTDLANELLDITGRLHNTAFQRVDRCAAAHGITAHVPFADPNLFEYAFQIPSGLKLKDGIEKWILRKSMEGMLPENIVWRPKAKFWEGAGVEELISDFVSTQIKDSEFNAERKLNNGWTLRTKEELYYYRIFKEHFGELENLEWMGRTKQVSDDM
jgi:asparagine synthase (glutamine-hydrolysing)